MSSPPIDPGSPPTDPLPGGLAEAFRHDPRVGTILGGKYRIVGKLGQGGMGVVYEAEDTLLKRPVAIKLLPEAVSNNEAALQRFLQEAQAAARLNHPNVIAIHEIERDGGYFIVMELVRGHSVDRHMRATGPLGWREATRIIADTCRGLVAAHEARLIHRDIKPGNIMRAANGAIKLADFGLAKPTDSSAATPTLSGHVIGTPDYMSPEQCMCESLGPASDIYSLGATYCALLTGQPPYRGDSPYQVMNGHCSQPIPELRALDPSIPEACAAIVRRSMAKQPWERYASAAEMLAALDAALAASSTAARVEIQTPTPQAGLTRHRRPRFRGRTAAVFVVAACLGGLGAVVVWRNSSEHAVTTSKDAPASAGMGPGPKVEPADDAWRRSVASMKPEQQLAAVLLKLKELNPEFDGKPYRQRIEGEAVLELCLETDKVKDLTPVPALAELQHFCCCTPVGARAGQLTDLSPLQGMKLTAPHVCNTKVSDLSLLRQLPLEELDFRGTAVTDLRVLQGMQLQKLICGYNTISDLTPLQGMPLTLLSCEYTAIKDLSPLAGMQLTSLNINETLVTDLSPLAGMKLTEASLVPHTKVKDYSILKGMPLQILWLQFDYGRDAQLLRSIKTLDKINGMTVADFWKDAEAKRRDQK